MFERALDVDHRNITLWLKYAELEMRSRQVIVNLFVASFRQSFIKLRKFDQFKCMLFNFLVSNYFHGENFLKSKILMNAFALNNHNGLGQPFDNIFQKV